MFTFFYPVNTTCLNYVLLCEFFRVVQCCTLIIFNERSCECFNEDFGWWLKETPPPPTPTPCWYFQLVGRRAHINLQ